MSVLCQVGGAAAWHDVYEEFQQQPGEAISDRLTIFVMLVPLSFRFDNGRITWQFFRDAPPAATALVLTAALVCWSSFLYIRRRLRSAGLQGGKIKKSVTF